MFERVIKEEYDDRMVKLHKFYNYLVKTYVTNYNKIKNIKKKDNVGKVAQAVLPNYQHFITTSIIYYQLGSNMLNIVYKQHKVYWDETKNKYY